MARVGDIIDGKYEILREIGRGGMSIVYLAMDRRLNKQWAIKEFRKDKDDVSKQVALKALLDEANLMKKLDHPTLPRIVDIIDENRNVYVIMDYIEGESLNKVLDAYGAQPQEAVIEWAKQLSEVLDYLHTQNPPVIYRDMKPANIMLKPDGTVRLIDFGIAREYKEGKTGDTEAIGTRGYAAPEQFGGKGQTDARTDIYSLGVTLYHLLTGKNPAEPPYEIYPIRHWDPTFSSGLEWLIQKCTQLNPSDRYQSCAEVSYVLENLDKFDTEYKKQKQKKMSLFFGSLLLTVLFAAISAGCFLGSQSARRNSYDSLVQEKNYISAIAIDKTNPLAYVELAKQIDESQVSIIPGDASGRDSIEDSVTLGDLRAWFPDSAMAAIREEHPADFAFIHFKLGFAEWEQYKGVNPYDPKEKMRPAISHFEKVLSIATEGTAGEYAGLTELQFNLVRAYYAVSFFTVNNELLTQNAAGETINLTYIEELAGIDAEIFAEDPFLAFWNADVNVIALLNSDANMMPIVKLNALENIEIIFTSYYPRFCDRVTPEEMQEFFRNYETAFNSVPDTEEQYVELKNQIRIDFNENVVKQVNAQYQEKDEYKNLQLEGVR